MKHIRIIPRLDIKGPNLVKGIHLEGLRVLGKPEKFARFYYENGADELIYMDVVASLYGRNSLHDIVNLTSKEIFIPLTVGGGIRTLDDVRDVLRAGADKVSINTAAILNPDIIRQASLKFGSSTIVVSIEAMKQPNGKYLAFTNCGREYTSVEVINWAQKVQELGAGEIFLTSIDRDGTGEGFDCELVKMVSQAVSIPVIAYGGAGSPEDVKTVITQGQADAVSISSILHYECCNNLAFDEDGFENEGNIEYMKKQINFSKIKPYSLDAIKQYLIENNINCRNTSKANV